MFKNQLVSRNNFNLLEEPIKTSSSIENSPYSQTQTSCSFQESKKPEEIRVSEFQNILKPIPLYYFCSQENNNLNEHMNIISYDSYINFLKMNSNKNEKINFIGRKRYMDNKDLFFQEKEIKEIRIDENINSNLISAFKKVEINRSKSLISRKNISTQKKNLTNKIIINEENNLNEVENKDKSPKKLRLFKSIKSFPNEDNNDEISDGHIVEKKRRGRKPKEEVNSKMKRIHEAYDYDNILRKIQVHFLTFIISFANDLIEAFIPNCKELRFKNLSYNIKKTVSHSYVEELKNKTIGDILQFKASSKNRKFSDSINEQIYQKVCYLSPFLKHFFKISYLELFSEYYFKVNRSFCIEGININASQKTKFFVDLVQKNIEAADKIRQIAINNFMKSKKEVKQPIFLINKKNNQ